MRVSDVLRVKGDGVVTMPPEDTVARLLEVLAEHGIGAVVVSPDGRRVAGIVSERDVVRALARLGADVLAAPVERICTTDVRTVTPDVSLQECERLMVQRRFRHLPVLVDGGLSGLVSIGDVVKGRIDELETERSELAGYITGERAP